MKEVGFYRSSHADTWSAAPDGPRIGGFYLYGNDVTRGLAVYKFEGSGAPSARAGPWMTPTEAQLKFPERPMLTATSDYPAGLPARRVAAWDPAVRWGVPARRP